MDIIDVEIWELSGDMVFATMLFDLDGTSTSVEIPSGTFTPGMTYEAWVNFVRVVDLDQATYPGAIGAAVYGTGTQFTIATQGSGGLWGNAVDLGNGWKWLGWFGFFNTNFDPWTFHLQHRWLFPFGITTASVTFWDNAMGAFWWTSESVYPYGYRFGDGAWLFYEVGSVNPRWFYNFQIAQWESYP